jgi:hypothetical protein
MTNKEALQSILPFQASESFIEKSMIDSGLDGAVTYSSNTKKGVDLCLADMISCKIAEPDFSEEGFSLSANRGALSQLRSEILRRYGLQTGGISDASALW